MPHHLAILLLTLLLSNTALLRAAETDAIPEWVVAGIAAVETSSIYRNGRLIEYRDRRDGLAGEVGPWQLTPAVLIDLDAEHLLPRVRAEPLLAERLARAWMLRCFHRTGDWFSAVAIYHTGPRGDSERGRRYAERVHAAGTDEAP